nr:hypothetical protein GTC16762_08940 [Pigmentibacter ruber]
MPLELNLFQNHNPTKPKEGITKNILLLMILNTLKNMYLKIFFGKLKNIE